MGLLPLLVAGSYSSYFQGMRNIYREIKSGEPAVTALAVAERAARSALTASTSLVKGLPALARDDAPTT